MAYLCSTNPANGTGFRLLRIYSLHTRIDDFEESTICRTVASVPLLESNMITLKNLPAVTLSHTAGRTFSSLRG
eukprot:scaffold10505_cov109-Skeletonema_marinoi.AAC.3